MPTIFYWNGYRFYFFSLENGEPVHIHVEKAEGSAKFWLDPFVKNIRMVLQQGSVRKFVNSLTQTVNNKKKPGMSTSKIINKRAKDPIDRVIFEKGLRIKNILVEKDLDLIAIVLNNGFIIKETLSTYPLLKAASISQLQNWRLISGGIGINWPNLDEDLSLRRFIQQSALQETLRLLETRRPIQKIIA